MIGLYTKLISSGASLILQILVVVTAVLVFMYFDPFGVVTQEKKTLADTPVQVESIRKMGELITAEYYGEVVASLGEAIDSIEVETVTEFNETTDDLHEEFKIAIDSLVKIEGLRKESEIHSVFNNENEDLINHPRYNEYINFIYKELSGDIYKPKHLDKSLPNRLERRLLKRLYKNLKNWSTKLKTTKALKFKTVHQTQVETDLKKKYRSPRLAMIGRGWVKAGIDFENFNEGNFVYNKQQKTIHFFGVEPRIISATINPWFIPKEGVEGFEFLIADRRVKMKPEYTKMVKQLCMDKLMAQATSKKILNEAKKNAERYLKDFFSLMLDKEIKHVEFHTDPLSSTLKTVMLDSVIRNEEILYIDSTLIAFASEIPDSAGPHRLERLQRVSFFLDSLYRLDFHMMNQKMALNSNSSTLFKIFEDRIIDSDDAQYFSELDTGSHLDSIWNLDVDYKLESKLQGDLKDSIGPLQVWNDEDTTIGQRLTAKMTKAKKDSCSNRQMTNKLKALDFVKSAIKGTEIGIDTLNNHALKSDSLTVINTDSIRSNPEEYLFGQEVKALPPPQKK